MWCPGEERGRGRCATSEEVQLDRPASELADCGRPPCLARCGSVRTGRPLAGEGGELGGQGLSLRIDLRLTRGTAWGVGLRGEAARRVRLPRGEAARRVGLARVGWRRRVG